MVFFPDPFTQLPAAWQGLNPAHSPRELPSESGEPLCLVESIPPSFLEEAHTIRDILRQGTKAGPMPTYLVLP